MITARRLGLALPLAFWLAAAGAARAAEPLNDTSPHRSGFVSVDGVRLHYLDWGGTGEPVLLLAGLGNTAHVFDSFAPQLTDRFHVLALTRRGFGESAQPASGYDLRTLVEDVRGFLDSQGIQRVHLAGHSIAGEEMTRFAATYPDRVGKLIYLDAAYDRINLLRMFIVSTLLGTPPPQPPGATRAERASVEAYTGYLAKVYGVRLPAGEVLATRLFSEEGVYIRDVTPASIPSAVVKAVEHPPYGRIAAPALALYAGTETVDQIAPWLPRHSPARLQARAYLTRWWQPYVKSQRKKFEREMANGRAEVIAGSRHHLFLSNEDEVVREVREFLLAR